jgi:hypothetical protein
MMDDFHCTHLCIAEWPAVYVAENKDVYASCFKIIQVVDFESIIGFLTKGHSCRKQQDQAQDYQSEWSTERNWSVRHYL